MAAVRRNSVDVLLDAASALMVERNTVNITFADIAGRSGLNSALIHYRFGGKTGLFRALLERDAGGTVSDLEALLVADMPAIEKLRAHVRSIIDTYHRYPYLNRLITALAVESDSDTARFIADRFTSPMAAAQRAILEQGLAEGTFRPVDPMLFYFALIGACDHLFNARHSLTFTFGVHDIDESLSRRYADHINSIVLAGVLTPLAVAEGHA